MRGARHAAEMLTHESFNCAILPTDERELYGCVYIDPAGDDAVLDDAAPGPAADVSWWLVADAPAGLAQAVADFVPRWLARDWPFTRVAYPFGELG